MKRLDRFVIEETLVNGPVTVFKALEQMPGDVTRPVMLRVHPVKDAAAQGRFINEARVLASLTSEKAVATIYAIGLTDGMAWVASEYLPVTAASMMSDAPGKPDDVVRLLTDVLEGLHAIHTNNPPVLHLDVKPANILMDKHGRFRIANFSMASAVSDDPVYAADSARYTPPEVLSKDFGPKSPASDLYALGHVAYELALGGRQYRHVMPAIFEGVSTKDMPSASRFMQWHCSLSTKAMDVSDARKDFPAEVSAVIARLMAKSAKERFASAAEALAALKAASQPVAAPVTEGAPTAAPARVAATVPPPRFSRTAPPPAAAEVTPAPAAPAAPAAASNAPASGGGDPGSTRYYVRLRGRQTGPFDLITLQRQVRQGLVSRLHQVSTDGITWKAVTTVEGLF